MARPNKERSVFAEAHVAERIRRTRELRHWSMDGLAKRMSDAGCPIAPSAIHKIENAGRRITVDELVALSQVLGMSMAELVLSPDQQTDEHVSERLAEFQECLQEYRTQVEELELAKWAAQKALTDIVVELRALGAPSSAISELYRSLTESERVFLGEAFLPDATHNDANFRQAGM